MTLFLNYNKDYIKLEYDIYFNKHLSVEIPDNEIKKIYKLQTISNYTLKNKSAIFTLDRKDDGICIKQYKDDGNIKIELSLYETLQFRLFMMTCLKKPKLDSEFDIIFSFGFANGLGLKVCKLDKYIQFNLTSSGFSKCKLPFNERPNFMYNTSDLYEKFILEEDVIKKIRKFAKHVFIFNRLCWYTE